MSQGKYYITAQAAAVTPEGCIYYNENFFNYQNAIDLIREWNTTVQLIIIVIIIKYPNKVPTINITVFLVIEFFFCSKRKSNRLTYIIFFFTYFLYQAVLFISVFSMMSRNNSKALNFRVKDMIRIFFLPITWTRKYPE